MGIGNSSDSAAGDRSQCFSSSDLQKDGPKSEQGSEPPALAPVPAPVPAPAPTAAPAPGRCVACGIVITNCSNCSAPVSLSASASSSSSSSFAGAGDDNDGSINKDLRPLTTIPVVPAAAPAAPLSSSASSFRTFTYDSSPVLVSSAASSPLFSALPGPASGVIASSSSSSSAASSSSAKTDRHPPAHTSHGSVDGINLDQTVDEKRLRAISDLDRHVPLCRFVLTGGPCAGKTTALARLSTYLRQRGFRVFTVPEAATIMFSNGATFRDLDTDDKVIDFQYNLLCVQRQLETTFANLAKSAGQPAVLLCDRGTMDGSAYVSADVWSKLLARYNLDNVSLRDGRYNAVFHLVTAANGAEKHYSLDNNATRLETIEEARTVDMKLQEAWIGHPKLMIFDNSSDFEGKMQRLVAGVSTMVGLPSVDKRFKKFALAAPPKFPKSFRYEEFEVQKVYISLKKDKDGANTAAGGAREDYSFVRRRAQGALSSYGQTTVRFTDDGQKIESKRIIRARDYQYAVDNLADPARIPVKQRRQSFLWNAHYFEVSIYTSPHTGLCVLNCQVRDDTDVDFLPSWLQVLQEISGEPAYSAYHLSSPALAAKLSIASTSAVPALLSSPTVSLSTTKVEQSNN